MAAFGEVLTALPVSMERTGAPDNAPIGDPQPPAEAKTDADWAALRANADTLRANAEPVTTPKALAPKDWFEVSTMGPTEAEAAWARGFKGEGVTVAVNDDGIDFSHPDLMGTQKIITDPASPYAGWPEVFSPFSLLGYAYDYYGIIPYISGGTYYGMHYADTSTMPTLSTCGANCRSFTYTPWLSFQRPGFEHTYYFDAGMSKSGQVHVGTHPDYTLRDAVWGERPAVLVIDAHTAGVYDTVIIDLNDNYDFRDDQMLTKADLGNLENTKNDMIAGLDITGDGLADISGGMLYFIADGSTPIPVSDWLYGYGGFVPDNGDLVAISGGNIAPISQGGDYSHGTQCASNIAGQGVIDGYVTTLLNRDNTVANPGAKAVMGVAPEAKLVNVSDIYWNFDSSKIDAFLFGAFSYDGIDQTGWSWLDGSSGNTDTDAIQVTSNSYGSSNIDNDGWDFDTQFMTLIQLVDAPQLQYTISTGNGGPGFGTVTPASPTTGINVGASTEFGSTGWDSIKYLDQLNFNDVTPFSNRGPSARDGSGTDVVAGGAYAGGDYKLNTSAWGLDGNYAWDTWGGTSRSAPVTAGVLALVDQAYESANGDFPDFDTAKTLLMASANDLSNNVFTQGAGAINANRGTLIASGEYGVYPDINAWVPGVMTFGDVAYNTLATPGETYDQIITLNNPSASDIEVSLSAGAPQKLNQVGEGTFSWTLTTDMFNARSTQNGLKVPQFIIPLFANSSAVTGNAEAEAWWKTYLPDGVPDGTDLMVVRLVIPYDTFDNPPANYVDDLRERLVVYNWSDENGDGYVWHDLNDNGAVNYKLGGYGPFIDGLRDVVWSDPANEIDQYEYERFAYNNPVNNTLEVIVQNPLSRTHDGAFAGLYFTSGGITTDVDLQFQVDFYQYQPVSWLAIEDGSGTPIDELTIPAGGTAEFTAVAAPAADMPAGAYDAAIKVVDPGTVDYPAHTTTIPVVMSLAASYDGTDNVQFGGNPADSYNVDRQYNNSTVKGYFDWGWREESGDTRFFYTNVDIPSPASGTKLLVKTTWDETSPYHSDIDTTILGPTQYDFDPYFGKYWTLDTIGRSPDVRSGRAVWNFNTSTGMNEDWVASSALMPSPILSPLKPPVGIYAPYEVLLHNVLYKGDKNELPFSATLGKVVSTPDEVSSTVYLDEGQAGLMHFTSSFAHSGLAADVFGLGGPQDFTDVPLPATGTGVDFVKSYTLDHAGLIQISTKSSDVSDLDLYLYYCGPTGTSCSQRASSAGPDAEESVKVVLPEDGVWMMVVDNYAGAPGTFDYTENIAMGTDLSVVNLSSTAIDPNQELTFEIHYNRPGMTPGKTYEGLLVYGPAEAPAMFQVPIHITRAESSAKISKGVDFSVTYPGDTLKYTVTLENMSDDSATFEFIDPIPDNTTYVPGSLTGGPVGVAYEVGSNRIYYSGMLPLTPANEVLTYEVMVDSPLPGDVTSIENMASLDVTHTLVGFDQVEHATASAVSTIGTAVNLSTSYKEATATVKPGDVIDYAIHVINTGDAAILVDLMDAIPANTTIASVDSSEYANFMYDYGSDAVIWTGPVGGHEEKVFNFQVTLDPDYQGYLISNSAQISEYTAARNGSVLMTVSADTHVMQPIYLPVVANQ